MGPCRESNRVAGSVLVVGDIHEDVGFAETVLNHFFKQRVVSEAVFLGDYWDSFTRTPSTTRRTCDFVSTLLADHRVTCLLGNHDIHYMHPQTGMGCSGYRVETQALIDHRPKLRPLASIQGRIVVERHGWLLSHAGVHPEFALRGGPLVGRLPAEEAQAETVLRSRQGGRPVGQQHWFWYVGFDRGGRDSIGGPLWLDWANFVDDTRVPPQLVGHTPQTRATQCGRSWNIDTQLRQVALLGEDGSVSIERVR